MGGTPSGNRAASNIQAYFKKLGLASEVLEDAPALTHWESDWSIELLPDSVQIASAYPFGYSPSVRPERTGALVVIDEFNRRTAGPNLNGQVIFTHTDGQLAFASVALTRVKPLAILTDYPHRPDKYPEWSRIDQLPPRADNAVAVFGVSYRDGERLAKAGSGVRVRVALSSSVQEARPRTVIATLAGRVAQQYYLICAHGDSDSGGPGADDNASGVATVLEIARVFTDLIRSNQLARPRVSLRFAIWGREYDSAESYVQREGEKLRQCLGVINFDQTGTGAEREAVYVESNDVPWNEPLLRTLARVGDDYMGQPGFWPEFKTSPSQGGTDSYVFLPTRFNGTGSTDFEIPSTSIYTAAWDHLSVLAQTPGWEPAGSGGGNKVVIDYSRYYHSSGDTPENTTEQEPQNMTRAVKAAGLALLRLAFQ